MIKSAHFIPVRTSYSVEYYAKLYIPEMVKLHVFGNSKTKSVVVSFYYHCGICLTSSGSFVEFFSKLKAHDDPNSREVQVAGTQAIGENITKTIHMPLDGDSTTDPSAGLDDGHEE
ncbi:hypothetical protein MTR67_017807 [Solanum verrucosum]|uniref:Uncharacterized protein n=1 Tax=Solanum verrucosum TaxID=315347 RepID=A0AAF0QKJ9_SOLVR|nr:hypothetical protein MTR67_017807 [Solanum verrucosum]